MRKLTLRFAVLPALAFLAACAQLPISIPGTEDNPGEANAVLAAMDRYMIAISTKNYAAQRALDMPNAMTWSARYGASGALVVTPRPNTYWTDPARDTGKAFEERYWKPTVLVRGPIAMVWAPYEFKIDAKTSHCGVDVFDFVKVDGAWRVANAMWTVEPEACAMLRPTDGSPIRP